MKCLVSIILLMIVLAVSCGPSYVRIEEKPETANVSSAEPAIAAYAQLSKGELTAVLKELQKREFLAKEKAVKAREKYMQAEEEYKNAEKKEKPEVLIKKLEARAEMEASNTEHKELQKELFAAKEAYLKKGK